MDTTQPSSSSVIDDDGDSSVAAPAALSEAASVSAATATPLESSVPSDRDTSELSDTESSDQNQSLSKPTRRELLEALQQHLEVLDRRGEVSSVIPSFLRRTHLQQGRHKANADTANSSTTGMQPHTQISRQSTDKNRYYEELAKEMERIPEIVNFSRKRRAAANESDASEVSGMVSSSHDGNESPNSSETSDFTSSQPSKKSHPDSPT